MTAVECGEESVSVARVAADGVYETVICRPGCVDIVLVANARAGEAPEAMFERLAGRVAQRGGAIVSQNVFHCSRRMEQCQAAMGSILGRADWPITWLEADNGDGSGGGNGDRMQLSGSVVHAVAGPQVRSVSVDGRIVGRAWEDGVASHCALGDLRSGDSGAGGDVQTLAVLGQMEAALSQVGMDFSHIYRTWYWNHDILSWYAAFNAARTKFYADRGVGQVVLPASTGIGAKNAFGTALTAGLLAANPTGSNDGPLVREISSPLQSSAEDYGSTFSRAVEFDSGAHRMVTVSGTASIDSAGWTMHIGDVAAQVAETMRVVGAILESRDMGWADVSRALAYVRHAADASVFVDYCRANGLEDMPVILTNNVVCREDLLFEIEVDTVVAT